MGSYYEVAQIALIGVIASARAKKEELIEERSDQDDVACALRDKQHKLRTALGQNDYPYAGGGRLYARPYGKKRPGTPSPVMTPPKKEIAFSEGEIDTMTKELAEIDKQLECIAADQNRNFRQHCDIDSVIFDLSKASAYLAAPDTMFIKFYDEHPSDQPC